MAYISKVKIQDTLYEITADKNSEKKTLATQEYSDAAAAAVKNELLNGAGDAYDTLKELGDLINENQNALEALEQIAISKEDDIPVQDNEPTDAVEGDLWIDTSEEGDSNYISKPEAVSEGQILTYSNGEWIAADAPEGGVTSVNGQTGAVTVQAKITGTAGDFVVIGSDGNVTTKTVAYAEEASF